MYKAFIVDDEPAIRSGLKQIIPWEEYGIELQGEASNGLEAYEFIEVHQPDIVICDIRMPVMNGLELIKRVYDEGIPSMFIILSGHDDFHYVKEALKYKVENYLLKPINDEELEQTIHQITYKLESDLLRDVELTKEHELLRNNVLNRIITNQIDLFEFKNKLNFIHTKINLFDSKLQVIVIDFLTKNTDKSSSLMNIIKSIEGVCMRTIPLDQAVVFVDVQGRIVLIYKVLIEKPSYKEQIQKYVQTIIERSPKVPDVKWVISAGDIVNSYKKLHVSYQHSLSIQQYRLYYDEQDVIFYDDIKTKQKANSKLYSVDYEYIDNSILNCNRHEINRYLKNCFDHLSHEGMDPDAVYTFVMEVVISLLRIIRTQGIIESEIFDDESFLLKTIHEFKDIEELNQWIEEKIMAIISCIEHQNTTKLSKVTKDLLVYIDKHFNEDLSLKTYSQEIHYNAIYLGRLFRNETDEVFSDYVNKVRIEKSKNLLRNSSLKTSEIAKSIGFSNANYYYRIFKKLVGITPSEFRNQ